MMEDRDDSENSQETIRDKIGDEHLAWEIIIPKLDYQSQLKMSQQSQRLAQIVQRNAESDIRKFRREIQKNKYM